MGSLTRGAIISEGLELAGNTGLTERARVWLNTWLDQVYASWEWPFLPHGQQGLSMPAGAAGLAFGAGEGVASRVAEIKRVFVDRQALPLVGRDDLDEEPDATAFGTPQRILVEPSGVVGRWQLKPLPGADRSYAVAVDYRGLPAQLSADEETPVYPSDETMIQAVLTKALRHQVDERWVAEQQVLRSMVAADRVTFGTAPGKGQKLQLSRGCYRR